MSALVGPGQLRSEIEQHDPLLLDVRWTLAGSDREGYLAGHLPGAIFCDLDTVLAAPGGAGGRHPLPDAAQLARSLALLGVRSGRQVVVYDGGVAAAAARAWWCLRWVGHDDVRVLDGGLPAWVAAGGALESGDVPAQAAPSSSRSSTPASASVSASAPSSATFMPTVDAAQVLASISGGTGGTGGSGTDAADGAPGVLLDARSPERFRGEVEPIDPVAGHIPGARSLPSTGLVDDDGRYLPAPALRELFVAAGADGRQPVTTYCGSGITGAQLVLAAHEAGIDAALYPGSWSHWVTDPDRPVATGPA